MNSSFISACHFQVYAARRNLNGRVPQLKPVGLQLGHRSLVAVLVAGLVAGEN